MMEVIKKPVLGITIGDINGVGPELIMRIFSDSRMLELCTPAIYCNGRIFGFYRKFLNYTTFHYNQVENISQVQEGKVNVVNCWGEEEVEINPGQMTPNGGKYALISLKAAVEDWKNNRFDALITSPINKKNVADESFNFNGHTRYLTQEAGEKDSLMLMTCKDLKIGVATEHIALKEISAALTKELIIEKAKLMHKTLRNDFGIAKPKIAILGLNPHAGDGGLMGTEENEVIIPAIELLNKQNIMAIGPYPADGFFGSMEYKHFDGVLAMFHDQGLIPFKTIAFEQGVNFTAGMDKIRTSPDHGTAYSIVGKKKISAVSYREAVYLAIDIYNTRKGIIPVQQSSLAFD
jgi:4-hydroxythreonine-4-phosphate dehydrogenase